ncbi:MAG: response regulator [Cyanobacteria bacterium P01_G01_bin.39]
MYIEDDELRQLYKTSSSDHVQKLEADLMILEKNPQNADALEEFLREAHTLKGDSRMLGLDEIEMLVHHLEDCVEGIKAGQAEITPELCDRLYQGIDAINQLSHQAVTGEAVEVNALEVLASLMGSPGSNQEIAHASNLEADLFGDEGSLSNQSDAESFLFDDDFATDGSDLKADLAEASLFDDDEEFSSSQSDSESSLFDDDEDFSSSQFNSEASLFNDEPIVSPVATAPIEPVSNTNSQTLVTSSAQTSLKSSKTGQDYQIDTIRVEPEKLDTLMTQASELAVTKLRISQQMSQIEQISALWESWNKQDDTNVAEIEESITPELFQPLKQFLSITEQRVDSLGSLVNNLKTRANEDIASLGIISDRLESGIQGLRQLPLSTVFNIYPRMVRDLARQQGKDIELIIEGGDTKADKRILEEIKDPLLHLIRNAIDHGIEPPEERISHGKPQTATIVLRGYQSGSSIAIEISDDGRGLNLKSIRDTAIRRKVRTEAELASMSELQIQSLIFASGFSTRTEITELSGRGVGLDVVRANVERLKGSIQVNSTPGNGCKFQVRLNTSLATTKVLMVELNHTLYALPLEYIQTMITISPQNIYEIEGKTTITFEEQPLSITPLGSLLQLPTPQNNGTNNNLACIVIQINQEHNDSTRESLGLATKTQRFGIIVDDLVDQQDVVLKPQSKLLKRIPNILGATILGSGEVCMVLNPPDLLHSLQSGVWQQVDSAVESTVTKNRLLLVEDSLIIRTQMQRLLKGAGYQVTMAENGLQGLQQVQTEDFDIVLSDVEMPQMSGLEMTEKIRQQSEYNSLPIVLITTLASAEDKQRGKAAGANAYLTKGNFDQQLLFQTLEQLINP